MEKILKKYTTIPAHLYVNRNADNQLKRIIDDMQRPGYVLVARQMGKTNLLFNAKRTLENENRLFVYVDLSNLYDDERDCYRNIIDNIIEPNIDLFESIEGEIDKIRVKNLQPHNEYSRSLRVILNEFKGDVVIVLDEIDALKSVEYSDNIFAQIRSNYFSRTNFPEFEHLTYVLSGVIEPTELIKDRNKSPFNIGDKIYLDDFTKDEHQDFVERSKLKISQEISNEIFDWTKGNPRITFDICSEIETCFMNGEEITKELLDSIIKRKYLTTFDIAPIDHIRELVKTNKQIRKAVNQINRKQSSELSDEVKRKLYLYGIIDSKFDQETKIKNKIIEESLSEEWIKSVDKEQTFTLGNGFVRYENKEFNDAIEIFENILANTDSTKIDVETSNYFLGMSYYRLRDFDSASEYFANEYSMKNFTVDAKLYLGVCKLAVGEKEEGILLLEEWTEKETNTGAYFNALLNLAINLDDKERAKEILNKLYQSTFIADNVDENLKEEDLIEYRTLSLYYQAEILVRDSKVEEALIKINEALKIASKSLSLFILFYKYLLETEKDEFLKTRLVNNIIDNNLDFDTKNTYPISFSENLLHLYLNFVFDDSNLELFETLLDYSVKRLLPAAHKYEIVYRTVLKSSENRLKLLDYLLRFEQELDEEHLTNTYFQLAYYNSKNQKKFFEFFDKYFVSLSKTNRLNADDIYLFALGIRLHYEKENFVEAIKLFKLIEPRLSKIDDENLKLESIIIFYWCSASYFIIKDRINAKLYADSALKIISESNKKHTSMMDEKGLNIITNQLNQIKISSTVNQPVISTKKYGRNDKVKVKYSDGRVIENKYKKVESDILIGRCIVVE